MREGAKAKCQLCEDDVLPQKDIDSFDLSAIQKKHKLK